MELLNNKIEDYFILEDKEIPQSIYSSGSLYDSTNQSLFESIIDINLWAHDCNIVENSKVRLDQHKFKKLLIILKNNS